MIHRIQTIFWLLAAICTVIFLVYEFLPNFFFYEEIKVLIPACLAILLSGMTVFSFKKRNLQIFLSYFSNLALISIPILLYMNYPNEWREKFKFAILFIALGLVFNFLGIFFTKKDLKLLDSSSRLR